MKIYKKFVNLSLLFIFLTHQSALAAFDVKGIPLFNDGNICVNKLQGDTTTTTGLNLSSLQSSSESVQSNISSSGGSLCDMVPFFVGGAKLTTTNGITVQADPVVQGLGRGILISETAGNTSGVTSSGEPTGFNSLVSRLGGLAITIFEISLPIGCDVIDDDDDIVGASSNLSLLNDFSFPTCTSTNGLAIDCNAASGLLTAANGLVPATSSTPAKIRFVITSFNTIADVNMIDSILIKLDSQDIFCPSDVTGPLTATITAQNAINNPTMTETLGTADLGTPSAAAKISYATDTATSQKGEVSTNEVSTTPVLIGGSSTTSNIIQIEELHNESIPVGGFSSPVLINPSVSSNAENNTVNLWLIPTSTTLFSKVPSASDITFSDNSFIVNSEPYIVKTNSDDLNAPFGTLVISLRKNPTGTNPRTTKTIIKIKNLLLSSASTTDKDSTISLAFFEPVSGAIINVPGGLSVNNSTNPSNPQNFSSFAVDSTRALAQNVVVGSAVNEATAALQITTNADLASLTSRDTALGTPQIVDFTKIISSLTAPDTNKIMVTIANSILAINAEKGASISGSKIKIESFAKDSTTAFDSVTITSGKDGAFTAKLQADFSKGDVTLNFVQTISSANSSLSTKLIPKPSTVSSGLSCDKTVCGCDDINCIPTVSSLTAYISNNGGLPEIISKGGGILQEVINSAKKALGLS
ncbi:MAG: hypothetical protein HYY52_08430 [Candidatus Melainabacteria bacterium]|nr:hypothetical protein [Candidatus Melainabacteria bacterium]